MGSRMLVGIGIALTSFMPTKASPPAETSASVQQSAVDIQSIANLLPSEAAKEFSALPAKTRAEQIGVGPDDAVFFMVNPGLRVDRHLPPTDTAGSDRALAKAKVQKLLIGDRACEPGPLAEFLVDGVRATDASDSENSFAELLEEMGDRAFKKLLPVEVTAVDSGEALIGRAKSRWTAGKKFFLFTLDATCGTSAGGELSVWVELKLHRFEMTPIETETGSADPDKQRISSAQLMFSDSATGSASDLAESAANANDPNRFAPTVKAAIIDAFRERLALSVWNDLLQRKWTAPTPADAPRGAQRSESSKGARR